MVFRPEETVGRVSRDDFTAALDEAVLMNPPQRTLALLVVRVHGLHRLNATFGHIVNRRVVASLGERLRGILHGQDQIHLIADDEYGLILPNLSNRGHAELAATKILSTVAEPFRVGATLHTISVTIGIGTFAGQGAEAAQLLQRAELALASAEDTGKRYATYEDATALATTASWDVEAELVEAVENGELELYYQPQLDLKTNKITGAEGLMRWRHPLRGFLTPNFFIDAAERSSQIRPLTWSALNMALQRASQWPVREPALNVGVNISAGLLSDPEFSGMVSSAVAIWDIAPERLTLEITETALMHELDESYATVKRLHDMGLNISIDDFGTGYSSFSYFRNLPAREIKIDKCFIIKILDHHKDRDIVESLIDLAHKCDLRVIAEGVTDQATLDALRELDCDGVQGYYVAEPMSHDDFLQFLEDHRNGWKEP
ncbi:MAG TPA: bifunctional diguanylate cyclase/phosphodiesterase [Gammaproteobacteria bacterium]|nr:bifunctional diguanylate cyclase/phosphodiesterase [Gammaproteobacteria bacterium]